MDDVRLDYLFKLRLAVGRMGEMDGMGWWNTKGMLGPYGEKALGRGLPRTHYFAQARVVFEVARNRCEEVFSPPEGVTLWELPAEVEDRFEARWHEWLDEREKWDPFFAELTSADTDDLLSLLRGLDLISDEQADEVQGLRRSAEGRAVLLTDFDELDDRGLAMLAAGFSRGEKRRPAIPYIRMGGR